MIWSDYIETNGGVLSGKPAVKGTRLAVDFLLSLRGAGWSNVEQLENYPQLTPQALQAVYAYSAERLAEESYLSLAAG